MTTILFIERIEKETEKALQITLKVQWGSGKWHEKTFWFPKSVATLDGDKMIDVKTWFVEKMQNENAFNGYRMKFNEPVEFTK